MPAAVGGVLHEGNSGGIGARAVVEGANGPTTPGAEIDLRERGVAIVPDILANSGGVIGSYFEWVYHNRLERVDIREQVVAHVEDAFEAAADLAQSRDLPMREAAVCLGVQRVAEAHLARGLYP